MQCINFKLDHKVQTSHKGNIFHGSTSFKKKKVKREASEFPVHPLVDHLLITSRSTAVEIRTFYPQVPMSRYTFGSSRRENTVPQGHKAAKETAPASVYFEHRLGAELQGAIMANIKLNKDEN